MSSSKVERWPIGQVTPYPGNAKRHPPEQVVLIAQSLERFGWMQPILVDPDGVVIAGHGRLEAAKWLGLEEVPVVRLEASGDRAKALRLLDNRLAELGQWNKQLLAVELDAIGGTLVDLADFDDPELLIEPVDVEPVARPRQLNVCPKCLHEW